MSAHHGHAHHGHSHHGHSHHGHSHHGHSHHGHSHHGHSHGRAYATSVILNIAFVIVEVAYGVLSQSMALIADAAHNLSDVLGLLLAWGASSLAQRAPSAQRTYGWRKAPVLAALANAMLILLAVGGVIWEAVERLGATAPVDGMTMMIVAAIGVVINVLSALLFVRGRHDDINLRGAFTHLAADAAVSGAVVVAGVVVLMTGAQWVDPAISLAISLVIVLGTWQLLKDSLNMVLDAVPAHIDLVEVREALGRIAGVQAFHDLHVWAVGTTQTALTVHLRPEAGVDTDALIDTVNHELEERFGIHHTTIQIESERACDPCEGQ